MGLNLKQFFFSFQFKDLLDILFITLMIYFFITFLIRTRLWRAILVLGFLFIIYTLSLFGNLSFSKYFFDYFFQILVIILVISFQKELKKLFEPVIFSKLKRSRIKISFFDNLIQIITETVSWLQTTKTGAIIVFPGLEPIEDYLEGGFPLNGKVSPQILMSIFDKTSPGHDGAVIIDLDKITKFSVHLPLAENVEIVKKYGTRHRAALGLSEKTDALCLVVSEETGRVSVAYEGELKTVNSLFELQEILKKFFKEKYAHKSLKESRGLFKKIIFPIFVSFILALLFWGFFNLQSTVIQRSFLVPVEFYNLPNKMILDDLSDSQVAIVLIGKERDFKFLNEKDLKVTFDVSKLEPGWHRILIKKENIKNIKNFELVKVEPSTIKFHLKIQSD